MKINKEDEYGLRILLRIARSENEDGLSIPQLSELEGLSQSYVGKLTRALRLGGLVESNRGQKGGYVLSKTPAEISIKEIIDALGGQLFSKEFCESHNGMAKLCTNSVDCSVRSLWKMLQYTIDKVFENITLQNLIGEESSAHSELNVLLDNIFMPEKSIV